jgi:hypothetical protein
MMIRHPIIHEKIEAGPATFAAFQAPNNQPEPMIEPNPVNVNAKSPISRLKFSTFFCILSPSFVLVKDKVKAIIPKDFGSKIFEKNIIFRNIFDKKFVLLDCFS